MSQMPPMQMSSGLRPHRGTMILVFGILGLVCCVVFGIVAWVMGNGDLRAMQAGQMDRTGEGLTTAGKICGIVSVILNILILVGYVVALAFGLLAAGAAAATQRGGP